jgi:hypothetical protein
VLPAMAVTHVLAQQLRLKQRILLNLELVNHLKML